MPYRRLPKTDVTRLRALKTLLENDNIYTIRDRFIDWQTLNRAQSVYDKLYAACEQLKLSRLSQRRNTAKADKMIRNASLYVSHFIQVLLMAVERGEIRRSHLRLYGIEEDATSMPDFKSTERLIEWGERIVKGEKERIKLGGRPISNPSIGMVSTHLDVFKDAYMQQRKMVERTSNDLSRVQDIRPEADDVLLELWNQIEKHFESLPPDERLDRCRALGVIYYYRRKERKMMAHTPKS